VDPIADRLLVLVAIVTYVLNGELAVVELLLLLSRDIATALGLFVVRAVPRLASSRVQSSFSRKDRYRASTRDPASTRGRRATAAAIHRVGCACLGVRNRGLRARHLARQSAVITRRSGLGFRLALTSLELLAMTLPLASAAARRRLVLLDTLISEGVKGARPSPTSVLGGLRRLAWPAFQVTRDRGAPIEIRGPHHL